MIHTPQPHFGSTTSAFQLQHQQQTRGSTADIHPRGSADDLNTSRSGLQQSLKDNIMGNSEGDLIRIHWPRNSISRRVKKLSWEDENEMGTDRDISTLMTDPNFSVGPSRLDEEQSNSSHSEAQIAGRAIYF